MPMAMKRYKLIINYSRRVPAAVACRAFFMPHLHPSFATSSREISSAKPRTVACYLVTINALLSPGNVAGK